MVSQETQLFKEVYESLFNNVDSDAALDNLKEVVKQAVTLMKPNKIDIS